MTHFDTLDTLADYTRSDKVRALQAAKATASFALSMAALTFSVATWERATGGPSWLSWVKAFAEAAMVGGLADWFAVTALFHEIRLPIFRLPIPLITRHTALITREKKAIGENLADFVCNHFLTKQEVCRQLESVGLADAVSRFLADPAGAKRLADAVIDFMPRFLSALDSPELHSFLRSATKDKLSSMDVADKLAKVLVALTRDGKHQELVDHVLNEIAKAASTDTSRRAIAENVNLPILKESLANRIADGLHEWIKSVADDKDGKSRKALEAWIVEMIGRLLVDKDLCARIHDWRDRMLASDELGAYLSRLWRDTLDWLHLDISKPNSVIHAKVYGASQMLGAYIRADAESLNRWLIDFISETVDKHRGKVGAIIATKIDGWDDEQLVQELELAMGKELQAIRLNGTVVGGILGLGIYGVVEILQHLSAMIATH